MARREAYLEDIALEDALARFQAALEAVGALRPLAGESVSLEQAAGRVTAGPVWARSSSPHYHSAAMDGVAVRAAETYGASKSSPVRLKVPDQARWVDTGDAMPAGYDAVIMVEDVQQVGEDEIEIMASSAPWQHVRPLGEDIVATELVLPENHLVRPMDVGAMAAAGLTDVSVRRRPRVAILPTGSELIRPGDPLETGRIIEYNSLVLAGLAEEWGAVATRLEIVPDDFERLKAAVEEALPDHDIVVVNAGSSAGSEDFTAGVVSALGQLLVHGIAMRPGHPAILGVAQGKPLVGIPGYPVSAILTAELLVKPLVYRLQGVPMPARRRVAASITRKVLSPLGQDEFLRVKLGKVGDRMVATPLTRGAGVIMSLVRADGIVRLPRFSEGVQAGDDVEAELLRPLEEIERTIVAIGSHDLTLDLLASRLRRDYGDIGLSSSNVGSLGGLIALKRREAHLVGCHLLDEDTGEYNLPYVRRMLEGEPVVLVNLVHRQQGFMVPPGNPKNIRSLEDLLRPDVIFINRQRGSGTRVLLDWELKQRGISPNQIKGYGREEFTHTAVAAAVASGAADVGLGILAAARALGLDFLPLSKERYDLVIPRAFFESPLLQPLLQMLADSSFRGEVEALGGYDIAEMGKVMAEL